MKVETIADHPLTSVTLDDSDTTTGQLKQKLRKAERLNRVKAFMLVVPLLLFVGVTFVMPIAEMLHRSIYDPLVVESFPNTVAKLEDWQRQQLPGDDAFQAIAQELVTLQQQRQLSKVATRLNTECSGMRSLLTKTGRKLARQSELVDARQAMIGIDKRWADLGTWSAIKNLSSSYTLSYYLAALDMRYDTQGEIEAQPEQRQIYKTLLVKTFAISLLITVLCLVLGYPLAYMLATLPESRSNLLMILVLLPFWTSLLVRTTAWIALLQTNGVVNSTLLALGAIAEPLTLLYTEFATVLAMTHILLPFMVLPLYSVMKGIDPSYMRAAMSMGARPIRAWWSVYLPASLPGLSAGAMLVFIISVGYYITPALVGGTDGQMISNLIAFHMQQSNNWGLAAALGSLLLALILVIYFAFDRFVGASNIKLG